ncbi:MAG: hypothetical protein ACJAXT_001530 [Paracoccaceae bacterium]|jgi:hypothetical protein
MFITLMATIFAGFAGAGMVMLFRIALKDRIPGWATPLAAGGAMIAATIASEYSWYDGTVASLPAEFEIAATRENQAPYRPWTYLRPFTDGFIAVDQGSIRTNDAVPGTRLVNLYIYGRFSAITEVPVLFDCDDSQRADIIDGVEFDLDGIPLDVVWRDVDMTDPMLRATCDVDVG